MNTRSFGMLKPDCLINGHTEEAFRRITEGGCRIVLLKKIRLTDQDVTVLYGGLVDKPFFGELRQFLMSSDVIVFVAESDSPLGTIKILNRITGFTDPSKAKPGTLRSLGTSVKYNTAHSTANEEEYLKSTLHFFGEV